MSDTTDPVFDQVLNGLRLLEPQDRRKAFGIIKKEREDQLTEQRESAPLLPNSHFSQRDKLTRLPNPSAEAYEQKIYIPEFTFVGVFNQPDFGEVLLTFYPNEWTIELKSLKLYKDSFRQVPISYERVSNVMFEDLMAVYKPKRLRLMMRLRPRGGIASCLTIDSDWKIRGGEELFGDWSGNTDRFGFSKADGTRI